VAFADFAIGTAEVAYCHAKGRMFEQCIDQLAFIATNNGHCGNIGRLRRQVVNVPMRLFGLSEVVLQSAV